jgi:hypothetical protein
MKKLLHFDSVRNICAVSTVEEALAATHHARDPRWQKIEIAHEDERAMIEAGGHQRHFIAAIDDQSVPSKPIFIGNTLDGGNEFGIHPKEIVKLRISTDAAAGPDCACRADAHASVADAESGIEASTLTISWTCLEPIKLWIDTEPVAGPYGGLCHGSVQFTPPYPGRIRIWGKHPRYFMEPVIVHTFEPAVPEKENVDG